MTLQTGKIYKVKEGHEWKCGAYKEEEGKFIKITKINAEYSYDILNKNKKTIDYCGDCFTEDDLELEEEVKEKSLEDLEVGDMFISPDGEKHKVSGIEDITFKVDDCENIVFTLNYLKREGYKFYNPNETKVFSPSEAETLLEEKLGIKVKIK